MLRMLQESKCMDNNQQRKERVRSGNCISNFRGSFNLLAALFMSVASSTVSAGSYPAALVFTPINNQPSPSYDLTIDDSAVTRTRIKLGGNGLSKVFHMLVVANQPLTLHQNCMAGIDG